jgi:hypothetical protein
MRLPLFSLLFVVLFLALRLDAQPESINVLLVDKTEAGSPIEVSGKVSLQETVAGNQVQWSWGQHVVAKNISGKPILLFTATLTQIGRHPRGKYAGPGDGPTYELGDDRFFAKNAIKPDDSLVLRDTTPDTSQVECCINPLDESGQPQAEFRVLFVQFIDGSTFGEVSEAMEWLSTRAVILDGLRKLAQSYSKHGGQAFLAELEQQQQQSHSSGTLPIAEILGTYKQNGVEAAISQTRQILAIAEAHEAVIRSTAAK